MKLRSRAGWMLTLLCAFAAVATGHAQTTVSSVHYSNTVVRAWQDYHLLKGDGAHNVFVASGNVTIDGTVSHDVQVVLGEVMLSSTAVIEGSLFVTAGNAHIAPGAVVRGDLVMIGGSVEAPAGFAPGAGTFVMGEVFGDSLRAVLPWVTYGLLWGRVIVFSISWVWSVLFVSLVLTLALNLLLHKPVGACANALAVRPVSAFMTGLLMLLLAGPICALMAATIVGIALVPFVLCALIVAWLVGKVGVVRWIGASILPPAEDTRALALRSALIGFVAICLLYAVPVVGLVTWAMVGVFGLGSATLAFMTALRQERPAKPPKVKASSPHRSFRLTRSDASVASEASVPEAAAQAESSSSESHTEDASSQAPPPFTPPPAPAPPVPPSSASFDPAADLRGFPRAQFMERVAAAVLDVALLVMINNLMFYGDRYNSGYRDDSRFVLMLLYFVVFWATKGTTLGGIICNLRVVRIDAEPLRFSDALVRGLTGIFSFAALGIGFLWILRDPERQAWHDRIAGTYVVRVPRHWPLP